MANQVDFKILPSDQFNVYSPQTRSEKVITYFTLLSKLRGDILAVSSQDDPNSIVSAYYTNVGNTQTLHLVKADGSEVTASNDYAGTVTSVGVSMPSAFTVTNSPITTSGTIQITGAGTTAQYVRGDGTLATFPSLTGFVPYVGATQNVDLGEYQIKAGQVAFDLTPTGTAGVGIMRWNDQDGTVDLGLLGGNVTLQIGQEQVVRVVNKSGINLTEAGYQAVKITGAQGNRLKVGLAQANNDANSADTIGLVTENIALNAEGFVTSSGLVRNIDTTGALQGETWADGDVIYLSPTTPGAVTKVKPTAPQHTVILGFVVRAHQTQGQIYVKVDNGYELEELHDVAPTPYVNNGVLYRDTATNLWKSATIPTVLGYTPANSTTTISTTAPLSGGGDLSANRTLSISQAGASTDGYLSSTDWNTFNNKASDAFKTIAVSGQSNVVADSPTDTLTFEAGSNIVITTDAANDKITISAVGGGTGSVTSVDMTVPTGFAISGNPITTSGTLALAFASGYSLPTNASQTNWNTAYNDSITAFAYNTSTGVLTLTQQDAGTLTATVTLQPFTTTNLAEGTNLYFTTARARQSLSAGTGINYDNSTGIITNSAPDQIVSLTAGTGISTSGTYPSFTITNTAPDQTVVLTSGTGISTSGTYPNFTITNTAPDKTVVLTAGTGISTSGTYPNFTITNTAPDQIVSLTGAGTTVVTGTYPSFTITSNDQYTGTVTSVATSAPITGGTITTSGTIGITQSGASSDGYLSSTDWNTFNSKIGGSGTTNYVAKFTGSSAVGNSSIFDNGNVGIGTSSPASASGYTTLTIDGTSGSFTEYRQNGTALFRIGADSSRPFLYGMTNAPMDFYTNTSLRMRITGDGNVGIGTTSPLNPFVVSNGGANGVEINPNYLGQSYIVAYDRNAGQYRTINIEANEIQFRTGSSALIRGIITSGGNVGIGTTAPSQKLHVNGGNIAIDNSSDVSLIFAKSGVSKYEWYLDNASNNFGLYDRGNSSWRFFVTNAGNVGIGTTDPQGKLDVTDGVVSVAIKSTLAVESSSNNQTLAQINFYKHYGLAIGSAIRMLQSGGTSNYPQAHLAFFTNDGSAGWSTPTERMRITSAGNVGIGTTAPAIYGGWVGVDIRGGNGGQLIVANTAGTNRGEIFTDGNGFNVSAQTNNALLLKTNDSERMRITSTGNVGIGTTSPGARLQIGPHMQMDSSSIYGGQIGFNRNINTGAILNNSYGAYQFQNESGEFQFQVYNSSGGQVTIHRFLNNGNVSFAGNVGINTTTPSVRLHVNGDVAGGLGYNGGFYANTDGTGTDLNWGFDFSQTPPVDDYSTRVKFYSVPSSARKLGFWDSRTSSYMGYFDGGLSVPNFIIPSGNVGIGTTAPAEKLSVVGNIRSAGNVIASVGLGYGNYISMRHDDVNGYITITRAVYAGNLILEPYANVGISTTTPSYKLDVNGSVRSYGGLISNGYHADTYIENLLPAANNGSGQGDVQLRMWCSEPGITWSWAGFGYNVKNDGASPYGFGRVNTSFGQAYMRFSTDGNLYFYNANTSGTRVETMTLTNAGNIGIGTTAPTFKLDVRDGTNAIVRVLDTSTNNSLIMQAGTGAGMKITGYNYNTSTAVPLYISVDGANTIMQTGGGNVGIGTTSPSARLHVQAPTSSTEPSLFIQSGTSGVYGMIAAADAYHGLIMRGIPANQTNYSVTAQDSMSFFEYGGDFRFYTKGASFQLDAQINGGTGRFRGDVVAYYSFSDERLKDDIKPLEGSLDKVLAMQGVSYKWNSGERKGQSDIGLIAQQVEEVVPEVVREKTNIDGDTFKSVNYEHLVGVLIEAIKEQQKQIDELKAKLK